MPSRRRPFPSTAQVVTFHRSPTANETQRDGPTMRWLQTEYLLKGVYLGLVLYAALQQAAAGAHSWDALARVNLMALAGLLLALVVAGLAKMREGYRVRGRLLIFA